MFSIGDFAKHGRVSVRMLRHYDAIGLLRPAHVDQASNYRYYTAEQLTRLNRIIALKDLGFSLQQVATIVDEQISVPELRGMLRLRQMELQAAVTDTAARLARVEARLRSIETEATMSDEIVIKNLPALRLAELVAEADSFEPQDIGPVVGPLFESLCRLDIQPTGPGLARYRELPDGRIEVHAGLPVASDVAGATMVDVPAVDRAATIMHHGSMDDVLPSAQALIRWIDDNGYTTKELPRELSLAVPDDRAQWVTELQAPLA
ncbi:MerR family transcriptional regulator [Kibdelosporangium phytohabitans]|uniref:MerR family transcriptional regulator n=1 Tax=Kibdelosporangium phytohabitans TaxID=860235 RepID=A0A0N9I5G7_9PSEU|nr:MerR family transcriptional regulator [Kibdelosporangium phytohabitans]ALG10110.1 MerR family transcriptional regulator [Kibdelosporangium phytohabitans]MBE1461094.1 DNA-binding transcriptional MerR regulator [Kibdelosporangium phytohabitans]